MDYKIGNALDLMANCEDRSIDIIFTSPPFKDEDVQGDYWAFYDSFYNECMRIAKKAVCIINSATKINELMVRYPPKRLMIWGKTASSYTYRFNPILVYQISDEYKVNNFIWSDVFGVAPLLNAHKKHPYQDPELLYYTILKMFKGCKSVLDPFCGSGTTALACQRLRIECTLFEMNQGYEELIKDRLQVNTPKLNNW